MAGITPKVVRSKTAEYCREYYKKNRKERIAKATQYRNEHPEYREKARIRASAHWHGKSQEERSRLCYERRLKQRFKRTPEWYEDTLVGQGGHCALCDAVPGDRRFHVDHNHDCCPCEGTRYTCGNCVRSLLCDKCNTALGHLERFLKDALVFPMLGKNGSWTGRALRYLINWEQRHSTQGPQ